jgi:hypothetical protein
MSRRIKDKIKIIKIKSFSILCVAAIFSSGLIIIIII